MGADIVAAIDAAPEPFRCFWCGKRKRQPSEWEQERLRGGWARLCKPCARTRLNNPYNALLPMRRVGSGDA